ncbi:imidazole glycerol phosphate synthase subunit HisH [Haoranjiania flava]|uniref:Imidazole glycerol phosphate synthase subunit HisH n=1 Tax=Haoranjiania flava TaxID=1856322 RepID=A0AAE3IMU9_9BACT|nr:imidazole glycerol phosphate synthase subunit HisH [Haoranjiania flava]MCU7694960.1 imidazole glycerol phosphate synthase subunit HisH [Haoranjiania flava]
MKITIVKYNAGNVQSVLYALQRIGYNAVVTADPEEINQADKVILPGVGQAGSAMEYLKERGLDEVIVNLKQPILGICLGMQLMCRRSEEGDTPCLGIFDEEVMKFQSPQLKVPQIGWNTVYDLKSDLFAGMKENSFIYLVHGYYASVGTHTIAKANYIREYSTALQKDNFYGVQFHPEKSADAGELILKNFIEKI